MRLIDVDALRTDYDMAEDCNNCKTGWRSCQYDHIYSKMDFCGWLDDAPTVDAVPVVHGHWIPCHPLGDDTPEGYMCSVCHVGGWEKTNFCPHCGARMDGED